MNEFEEELQRAMRRVAPPAGFTDAVLARTRVKPGEVHVPAPKGRKTAGWPSFLLLAASLLLASGSALEVHHERELKVQRVAGQFNLALAVTAKTLRHIDQNVSRAGTTWNRQINLSQPGRGEYQ